MKTVHNHHTFETKNKKLNINQTATKKVQVLEEMNEMLKEYSTKSKINILSSNSTLPHHKKNPTTIIANQNQPKEFIQECFLSDEGKHSLMLKNELTNFRKAIEMKFIKSITNNKYKFPRYSYSICSSKKEKKLNLSNCQIT